MAPIRCVIVVVVVVVVVVLKCQKVRRLTVHHKMAMDSMLVEEGQTPDDQDDWVRPAEEVLPEIPVLA